MNEAGTQLTVVERAQVALNFDAVKKEFTELAASSKSIVAITNAASYDECHAAHMRLVKARTNTEKVGKSQREDAQTFVKTELALEKELLGIIGPEELRLKAIKEEHNTRIERERQAKAEAEAARLAKIQDGITFLVNRPGHYVGRPSTEIKDELNGLRQAVLDWAEEFRPQAEAAKAKSIAGLELMLAGTLAQEKAAADEAQRIADERAELARLRAEQEERDLKAAEVARQEAEEQAKRQAAIEAAEAASRAKIEAEERAAAKARAEADRIAQAEFDRRAQEEEKRLRAVREAEAKERAEQEAQERAERAKRDAEAERVRQQQAEVARVQAEAQEKLEAEKREIVRQQEELLATDRLIAVLRSRIGTLPRYGQIAKAIDDYLASQPASKSQAKRKEAA